MKHYKLVNGEVIETDAYSWAIAFEDRDKRLIGMTKIKDVTISTVFIGLEGEIFETMVFGGIADGYQRRCNTLEEAKIQHAAVLRHLPKEYK